MAAPSMHKVSDSRKKKTWKKLEEGNPKIRLGKDAHQRWISFMEENLLKTNREAAIRLLDRRYERQTTFPVRPSPSTLHKKSQPSTSSPVAASFQAEMQVLTSDISTSIY